MANHEQTVDRVFHALSDQTRRAIVLRLSEKPAAVGELFTPLPMALPSLLKHIRVLEDCGLVATRKVGRERICEMRPEALRLTDGWFAHQRALWEARLDRMEAYVLDLQTQEKNND
ncbi:DNA-binding transcriptional ArsR family regulator [Brevundimonas alba]|uniref:DNA-binding transcriptional ArsR family regulator n=1 Tax=Brevundimonas alba TaxID=74314 RepID=A0A7X5YJJ4_9CAUL|nr:metalloregulator ArsR/SmtB family transcription factor [Brevundimonas alba]NJC40366.1 DNA-binding transcriptional ArsR family regulator [Brevundimonas alba]